MRCTATKATSATTTASLACPNRQATSGQTPFDDGRRCNGVHAYNKGVHAALFYLAMMVIVASAGKLTDHSCYTSLNPATATVMDCSGKGLTGTSFFIIFLRPGRSSRSWTQAAS